MELLKEAFDQAYIIIENSYWQFAVYISFFILALIVHKKSDRTRRITGNVMLGASAPGLIISAGLIGHFLYAGFTFYEILKSGEYLCISDSELGYHLMYDVNNSVSGVFIFSPVFFAVIVIVSIVCGAVIINRKAGKAIGSVLVIYGLLLAGFTVWVVKAIFAFLAS